MSTAAAAAEAQRTMAAADASIGGRDDMPVQSGSDLRSRIVWRDESDHVERLREGSWRQEARAGSRRGQSKRFERRREGDPNVHPRAPARQTTP